MASPSRPRPLDPAIVRIVEALADLMVDRDIARLRAVAPMPAPAGVLAN